MAETNSSNSASTPSGNSGNSGYTGNPGNDDSVLGSLKGAGEASVNAWSRLGDLAGEFGRKFRADREADVSSGAHAVDGEDITEDNSGLAEQFKAAIANARTAYEGAENDRDFRAATASLAGDAESIFRDFAGSVTRAADVARESDEADEAKAAFQQALGEVRETFNTAVGQVRKRAEAAGTDSSSDSGAASGSDAHVDAEGAIADMRARLEDMISKVSGTFDRKESGAGSDSSGPADIIDGEVVDESRE